MDFENNQNETTGEDDLMEAIRQLKEAEENDEEITFDEDETEEKDEQSEEVEEEETESDEDDDSLDEEDDSEEVIEEEEPKKVQSKEDNARFARERREKETQAKIDAEIERVRQESPEFQLAKMLAEQYGTTPDIILEQMKEQQLQKKAEAEGVPIERLRKEQELESKLQAQEDKLNRLMFSQWQNQIQVESTNLLSKPEFSMLTQADMQAAADHMLTKLKANDIPLEDVVYMLHGRKIIEGQKKNAEQELLAKESGRSKKPLAPKTGKASDTQTLTDEERYVARQMGLSDEDYLKYK